MFVEQAKALDPRFLSMVIPSRWFAGGKGLDEFRESMLADNRMRLIVDYPELHRTCSRASISRAASATSSGTATITGDCDVTTHFEDEPPSTATRPLLETSSTSSSASTRRCRSCKKVVAVETGSRKSLSLPDEQAFDRTGQLRQPFGLRQTFKGKTTRSQDDVLVYQNGGTGTSPERDYRRATELDR